MHVAVKVSVWKRIELPENASKEEIIKALELGEEGINDLFDTYDNLGYDEIDNTEETLTPEDNGGQQTIELYSDEKGDGPIWINKSSEELFHCDLFNYTHSLNMKKVKFIDEGKTCSSPETWSIEMVQKDDGEYIDTFQYDSKSEYEHDLNLLNSKK